MSVSLAHASLHAAGRSAARGNRWKTSKEKHATFDLPLIVLINGVVELDEEEEEEEEEEEAKKQERKKRSRTERGKVRRKGFRSSFIVTKSILIQTPLK
ncbi:hypothetical protein E2C01_080344 [Portunus trituberculatus]|uniref:Uncharacterized protein n=1 Tax=Portunus trituberculatus TaxID=210409 RepID=A0A5B7IT75_PORTR|nr:hypothetical protein [Portunus trituberculatus]